MGFYYRTYTRLGKQTLGGHKQNLVCTRTQEKGAVTPQETDPDLPVSVQESLTEVWVREGLGSACMGPFELGHHYLHYLHCSLVSGQTTGREHSPAHQQKIGLKIYRVWPCASKQDSVPTATPLPPNSASLSLPSGSFHNPLILICQRATE